MRIEQYIPTPQYQLVLTYSELHSLYHLMLGMRRSQTLNADEEAFFLALKEWA